MQFVIVLCIYRFGLWNWYSENNPNGTITAIWNGSDRSTIQVCVPCSSASHWNSITEKASWTGILCHNKSLPYVIHFQCVSYNVVSVLRFHAYNSNLFNFYFRKVYNWAANTQISVIRVKLLHQLCHKIRCQCQRQLETCLVQQHPSQELPVQPRAAVLLV